MGKELAHRIQAARRLCIESGGEYALLAAIGGGVVGAVVGSLVAEPRGLAWGLLFAVSGSILGAMLGVVVGAVTGAAMGLLAGGVLIIDVAVEGVARRVFSPRGTALPAGPAEMLPAARCEGRDEPCPSSPPAGAIHDGA